MATYNGEKYVKAQIESILPQLSDDDEIIVSDDQSTDGTLTVVKEINDSRIKIYSCARNKQGLTKHACVVSNFENALNNARGEFIFLSDQDDIWLPEKYGKTMRLLRQYDLVVSDATVGDKDLNFLEKSFFYHFHSRKGILNNIYRCMYFGSCMAFNRKILNYSLPFPDYNETGHDLWIGLVAEMTGKVIFFQEPLIIYRRHENSITNITPKIDRSGRELIKKITGRIVIAKAVLSFYWRYKVCKKV
jgi:glycosyltransferase involved in cell wall biosynthesis